MLIYSIQQEDLNIWNLYLQNGNYETALKHAKSEIQTNVVRKAYAQDLLKCGKDTDAVC